MNIEDLALIPTE